MSAVDRFELRRALLGMLPARLRRSVLAEPPYVGYLERPGPHELAGADGTVTVAGWLFSPGAAVRKLSARAGPGPEVELRIGLPRPDLAGAFGDQPRAAHAGFSGQVPVPEGQAPVPLTVWAHGVADRRVVCFTSVVQAAMRAVTPSEQARAERLRQPFLAWLRAAATGHPRVLEAGPLIFDALCEQRNRRQEPIAGLERMLAPPPRAPATAVARGTGERRPLLVVSAMFPSINHGGGLRLFDILSQLGERHAIDLYSTYREDLDGASLAALLPSLRAVRLWPSDELDASDLLDWAHRHGAGPGHYDAVHFEWPQTAAVIPAVAPLGHRRLFTLMECTTRAAVLGLEQALDRPAALGEAARSFAIAFSRERTGLAVCQGIAVSDEDADFAARTFGVARPEVIPTCLSEQQFLRHLPAEPAAPEDLPPIAAFVGYFDHYPNQDAVAWYLREVHFRVLERVPGYRLQVIGRGDTSRLRQLHAGEPSIVFTGPVDDLAAAIGAARIGIAPMLSGAGIRGKISQHAAARRPVVSTSLGASGLPFRDREEILIADSPERFADAVVSALTDHRLWRRLSEAAYARAMSDCRWPPWIARLEALHA